MNRDLERRLKQLDYVAHGMESLVPIPGTDMRMGLDPVLGFIPVVGDILGLLPAGYIIHSAHRMGASRRMVLRMVMNVGVDVVIGFVPLIGDIFDVSWKANTRNVALIRQMAEMKTAHAEYAQAAIESEYGTA